MKALKDGHGSPIVGQLPVFQEEEEGTFARVIFPQGPGSSITCVARTGEPPLQAALAAGQASTLPTSEKEKCAHRNRGLVRRNDLWFAVGDAGNGVGKDHRRVHRSTLTLAHQTILNVGSRLPVSKTFTQMGSFKISVCAVPPLHRPAMSQNK